MTGIFGIDINGKHIKDVEIPEEIINDIKEWWFSAKENDVFKIRCELQA